MAGWSIIIGSVVVVMSGYETIAGLHSLETREAIESALAEAPATGLGLDVGAVQQLIRLGSMVAAGCAAAAGILGYHVLQRRRSARIALTVLAVPLFLAGMATGGFFSSLVAVAVLTLWLHPSRSWFNGTWRPDADRGAARDTLPPPWPQPPQPPAPPTSAPAEPEPPVQARPVSGFGTPPAPPAYPLPGQPFPGPPPGLSAQQPGHRAVASRRPAAVVWAAVLTWVFAGLTLLSTLAAVAILAADPGPVLDELHRQQPDIAARGLSDDLIVNATYVMAGAVAIWSLVAIVLAGFAISRAPWARIALLVCAAATVGGLMLSVAVGQVLMLVPLAAAAAVVAMLSRADVRRWFARVP